MSNYNSLREHIADDKVDYLARYGCLDWHWFDEGIVWSIQDYIGSMGEFTGDDLKVLEENGFTQDDFKENFIDG